MANKEGKRLPTAGEQLADLPPPDVTTSAPPVEASAATAPPAQPDAPPPAPPAPPAPAARPAVPHDTDDLFVSCNPEAGPVARFIATLSPGPTPYIGAVIDPKVEGNIRYNTDEVVMVPGSEYRLFSKEYRRALADRALRLRTRAEWDQQQAAAAAGG